MKKHDMVNRSQGSHDPREVKLEIGSRGESVDFESDEPEVKSILQLLDGKSVGFNRLSNIEKAVKLFVGRSVIPKKEYDPFEVISFKKLAEDFGGTPRSIERQIGSVLGKSVSIKIGKTKGVRKVNLLRYFELNEYNN
jgi:hypothetical protein